MTDHDPRLTTDDVPDEIERSIHIDATAETVFAIVCEPGWYINDGEYREHEVTTDGAVSTVVDPVHGTFSIVTEALEPPHRAVFRWLSGASAGAADDADASSTVVEFTPPRRSDRGRRCAAHRARARFLDDERRRSGASHDLRGELPGMDRGARGRAHGGEKVREVSPRPGTGPPAVHDGPSGGASIPRRACSVEAPTPSSQHSRSRTRRQILVRLAETPDGTAGAVAGDLGLSRQAVAEEKQLRILETAGMVDAQRVSARRVHSVEPSRILAVSDLLGTVGGGWDRRLAHGSRSWPKRGGARPRRGTTAQVSGLSSEDGQGHRHHADPHRPGA